jgi:hypothetical protein
LDKCIICGVGVFGTGTQVRIRGIKNHKLVNYQLIVCSLECLTDLIERTNGLKK